ncbi:MAG: prepilin-type N-terminal cleavage/methylation domain-containing protein [Elusimicrobiota bacterium]|jgi:prepilin-type N-terminal cleavage/methylation domain-containing protein
MERRLVGARARGSGFTLIELMIVVAIIGILAAIAIPKFAELLRKSNEGKTKGNLGAMRSALTIYYADMEGNYPSDFYSLTIAGKYLAAVPRNRVPNYHPDTDIVRHNQNTNPFGCGSGYVLDSGQWIYWSDDGSLCAVAPAPVGQRARTRGEIWVACAHTDTKGSFWTSY